MRNLLLPFWYYTCCAWFYWSYCKARSPTKSKSTRNVIAATACNSKRWFKDFYDITPVTQRLYCVFCKEKSCSIQPLELGGWFGRSTSLYARCHCTVKFRRNCTVSNCFEFCYKIFLAFTYNWSWSSCRLLLNGLAQRLQHCDVGSVESWPWTLRHTRKYSKFIIWCLSSPNKRQAPNRTFCNWE